MKKFIEKIKSLDKGTIVRTVLQILVYINQIVAIVGQSSFITSPVYQWITLILTLLITSITYWYNNDWTKLAKVSRDVFDMLKDGTITSDEIQAFIEAHGKKESDSVK